ncbi:uncharacterized protein M421DRAFT_91236 [Didymella exigua CBS 183.55]|uniref:Uncharacterized protein n=1 Tax=Didymella exigua CBS 183.55 TaxID=1150837 RepID=A0A6A5RSS5_9PLEO|nr:uncharacterized protein M421DRAFT_91236 [Didymella exigua CBS 183.55]KAF1930038.1 hypothetical protein M421DRAFT_91236 [Didymella exigua CBS 183.55]
MAAAILPTTLTAALIVLIILLHLLRVQNSQVKRKAEAETPTRVDVLTDPLELGVLQGLGQYALGKAAIRDRAMQELAAAIKVLKSEFDVCERGEKIEAFALFVVGGGGHMPIMGASSINGGVPIEMIPFDKVVPSSDSKMVRFLKVLEEKGLAVAGGRNLTVGVRGRTLGSPLFSLPHALDSRAPTSSGVKILLADGSVFTASASKHPRL